MKVFYADFLMMIKGAPIANLEKCALLLVDLSFCVDFLHVLNPKKLNPNSRINSLVFCIKVVLPFEYID